MTLVLLMLVPRLLHADAGAGDAVTVTVSQTSPSFTKSFNTTLVDDGGNDLKFTYNVPQSDMNQADSVTASISVTDFAGNTGTLTGSTKSFTDDNVPPAAITSFAGASGETLIINKADNDGVAVEVGLPDNLIVGDIISIRIGSNEIATHTIASGEESGGLAKKAFTITESTIVGTNSLDRMERTR